MRDLHGSGRHLGPVLRSKSQRGRYRHGVRLLRVTVESVLGGAILLAIGYELRHHILWGAVVVALVCVLIIGAITAYERHLTHKIRVLKGFLVIHDPDEHPTCIQRRVVTTKAGMAASASPHLAAKSFTEVFLRVRVTTSVALHDVDVAIARDAPEKGGHLQRMGDHDGNRNSSRVSLRPKEDLYFDVAYSWLGEGVAGITYAESGPPYWMRDNFPVRARESMTFRATGRTEDDKLVSSKPVSSLVRVHRSSASHPPLSAALPRY